MSLPKDPASANRPDAEPDRQVEIAEVTELTMLELLQSRDERLVEGVRKLVAEHRIQPVTASWSSLLDPGERPSETSGS